MESLPTFGQRPTFYKRLAAGAQTVSPLLHASSDEQIVEQLRAHRLSVDRDSLRERCLEAGSAEEVTLGLIDPGLRPNLNDGQLAWIWMAIRVLWDRWFPDSPSFEKLDDRIAAGYDDKETPQGAEEWLAGYEILKKLGDKLQMHTLREFDRRFAGTELLHNWVQDLEMALGDLARPANHQDWHRRRIAFCEDFLARYPNDDESILKNMRRAWAESLWHVGEAQRADDLFKGWLAENPRWSWGWIGWADCYQFGPPDRRDLNRAEQILQQGLGVEGIEDREVFYERLQDIYEKQGRMDKLAQLRPLAGPKPGAAPLPVKRHGPKVGRNDPCPCGSGKKYKKCCGR